MHTQFGPYWLLRRIGLGDLAEVFVATQIQDGGGPGSAAADVGAPASNPGRLERLGKGVGLCAVKRISREMSSYAEVHELFAREGRLASLFAHPKVVETFEVGDVGGRPYICMEYIPGADLARLRDRDTSGRMPPGPAIRIILDVCEALHYVHDATDDDGRLLRVVHGDVTPTNILVSTSGVAKLIDFSVASSGMSDDDKPTVRGTYAYMSPEQVRGQPIDRRTDVFALGVVLWELLTGARLFRRQANYLTLAAVVEEPHPPLARMDDLRLGPGVSALDRILDKALAKDRDERYYTTAQLAADLTPLAKELDWDIRPWTLKTYVRELLS